LTTSIYAEFDIFWRVRSHLPTRRGRKDGYGANLWYMNFMANMITRGQYVFLLNTMNHSISTNARPLVATMLLSRKKHSKATAFW